MPTTKLMLLHFAELVQWGTGCSISGGLQSWWWGGENTFFYFLFFLKFVFSSSFVGCVRYCTGWLDSQQVSYKITAGSCDCLVVEVFFEQSFQCIPYWIGDCFRGKCKTLFSIQIGGKRHLPSSLPQRACVGQNLRAHRAVTINHSTVTPSALLFLLQQHVDAV